MNAQKIILIILGVAVVVGLGFVAVKSNNQLAEKGSNNGASIPATPIEIPTAPVENVTNLSAEFNKAITIKVNDKIIFPDNLEIVLKQINDSRCPKDVQCIWAGELAGTFAISGGKLSGSKEISLGTVNKKTATLGDYTFSLQNATTSSMTIVVEYKKPKTPLASCFVGGCSGQICSDQKDVVSTCEYREEYACYKTAKCERQASGQCGWTQTPALQQCLSK